MKLALKCLLTLILFGPCSLAIAIPLTTADALALLSSSNHSTANPSGFAKQYPTDEDKKALMLRSQQLLAIKYIGDNKIKEGIPNLIMYLDYAIAPGIGDPAHGDDIENVKENYIAFGALLNMPDVAPILKVYCLNEKAPMGYRLAVLHALKYINKDIFNNCWFLLKNGQASPKVEAYLEYLKDNRAQYSGVPKVE